MSTSKGTCSIEGCERDRVARGWCSTHYMRWKRHGTPDDPPPRTCSIEGCDRAHKSHGWCDAHYRRWQRYGDPLKGAPRASAVERFWAKVDVGGPRDCWLWTATKLPKGYGRFWDGQAKIYAHRFAYELLVGPIPAGLQIDHVKDRSCTSRACVNPAHLEAVTCRTNLLRGDTITATNAAKLRCPAGHEYIREINGTRRCYECKNARRRKR